MILTIEFLGPYGAADTTQRDAPEWPPHPDRVFQAMVDAANLSDPREIAALRWLEEQPHPGIVCPEVVAMPSVQVFVPVNYPDAGGDLDSRDHQPRYFPLAWPKGPVKLIWSEPPDDLRESLARIVSRMSHVGRAESHVVASVDAGTVKPSLVPAADGSLGLRVPYPGRLDDLEAVFRRGRYSALAPAVTYASTEHRVVNGPWREMVSVRLRHPLSLSRVAVATEALRSAVLSKLGDGAPAVAHGHNDDDHLAWVGLPNLSRFARGELLGLAMVIPRKASPRDRASCLQALLSLDHIMVDQRRIGIEAPTHAMSLASRTWTRPAKRWVTVSPVVLDQFPRRGLTKAAIVAHGVERAGYPRPRSVLLTEDAPDGFVPASKAFRLRKPGRLYAHALVEFDEAIQGPLLVGAERHFGLGMFRPSDSRTSSDSGSPRGSR